MITESQLLQLREDVLEIVRGLSKPQPQHHIRDCLVGTDSAAHTVYALRVIDALVDTGEITRHIATDGGRNTYSAGTPALLASRRRLRTLFEHDLTDGTTVPLPAPETPPPEPEPNPMMQAPKGPVPHNVTRITRNAKADPFRPGEPLRARILALVDEAKHCTRAYLASRLTDAKREAIDNTLWALCKAAQLHRVAPGEYTRPAGFDPTATVPAARPQRVRKAVAAAAPADDDASSSPADPAVAEDPAAEAEADAPDWFQPPAPTVQESLTVAPVFAGPITTLTGDITDSPARDLPLPIAAGMLRVLGELHTLGAALREHGNATTRRPAIADIEAKVAVLSSLTPMVAPHIATVLEAVANDLQQLARAA